MIIQYTTICDAAHQRGENLDDRCFINPEKVMADLQQRGAETRRRLYRDAGFSVPDDE